MRKFRRILLAVLFTAIGGPNAGADTTSTFDVLGTATNEKPASLGSCAAGASCQFSGKVTIDVTTGTITAFDITFPGVSSFTTVAVSEPTSVSWTLESFNVSNDLMILVFNPAPTPGSLVNFTGGTIFADFVEASNGSLLYEIASGSITPVSEPSSLAFILAGFVALPMMRKRIGHSRPSACLKRLP